ncbi:Guanine nucleotide-binding protein alpha-2 subunit [Venturia nashicola]|uniref:Guanine nucleotide-binding protein alpha-2 subunit n=1 Tax=Venturia nashicola TaxID=86259 RepID=A0A4Z1NUI9_9PEZI|nr:Guanine nucleotide-binding protein alpha-2 subunit [Venturia nashicola]TLD28117.1 Guanine nucleotide-binding protein alpha-2 subunit [Venturia nashicola]
MYPRSKPLIKIHDSGVTRWEYKPVEKVDIQYDSTSDSDESIIRPTTQTFRKWKRWIALAALLAITLIGSTLYILHQRSSTPDVDTRPKPVPTHKTVCNKPSKRLEWRQFNSSQKAAYISAVKCLMQQPSYFHENTSFYDDFIFAHSQVGHVAHYAAAFLPWHRMYVHVYEKALRTHCGYEGTWPYWDWTLDSKDLFASPVWDPIHGFGGNGNRNKLDAVVDGLCVTEGPFANVIRAWKGQRDNYDHAVTFYPHCMTRDFAFRTKSKEDVEWLHSLIMPEYVNAILKRPSYDLFFESFENGAHNSIPQLIRGDWLTFTAPNDPLFFLHHTQVDRLWWLWQMQDPGTRLKQFHGPAEDFRNTTIKHSQASKSDILPMGSIAEDMKVEDVMDTQGEYLCYEY